MICELVIFDMDGTLVQSEDCASQAMLDVIPGLTGTAHDVTAKYRGMRLADIFDDVESQCPGGVPANCLDLYRQRENVLSNTMITPSAGVEQMLGQLTTPRCIASNAPVEKTQRSLKLCGLGAYFDDAIYSAYQVNAWKPDPALFEYAAAEFGVQTGKCLVLEDSVVGIQAAVAASMTPVYYDPHGNEQAPEGVPVITELEELIGLLQTL